MSAFHKLMSALRSLRNLGIAPIVVAALVIGGGAILGYTRLAKHAPGASTYQVKREEFLEAIQFRGQVKAMRSVTITAPAEAGTLQIVKIATDGSHVNQGDVVVQFDASKTEQDLAQYRSTLKSAQAEIDQEIPEAGRAGALVDRAGGILPGGGEGPAQAALLQVQPDPQRGAADRLPGGAQLPDRFRALPGMELEVDSPGMEGAKLLHAGAALDRGQLLEAAVAHQAAPVIQAVSGEHGVA